MPHGLVFDMESLIEKISGYNLLNNLLPGILFCFIAETKLSLVIVPNDIVVALVVYYVVGMIVSRVGSLIVQPVLEFVGLFKPYDHHKYVAAERSDPKISPLLETANLYRSMVATAICLAAIWGWTEIKVHPLLADYSSVLELMGLFLLFLITYLKQLRYLASRVEKHAAGASEVEHDS